MTTIKKHDPLPNNKKTPQPPPIHCIDDDTDSDESIDNGTPLRPIFCLKRRSAIKDYDDKEDCFILDFNPEDALLDLSVENSHNDGLEGSPDICLIAEKGQVACRDYPHSRHLCVKYPFQKTSHDSYCKLCYCFVCDVAAPCKSWFGHNGGHCHAIDNEGWKIARRQLKKG